jgi:hypothetical protein
MDLVHQGEGKRFEAVISGLTIQLKEVADSKGIGPQVTGWWHSDRRKPGLLGKLRHDLPDKG